MYPTPDQTLSLIMVHPALFPLVRAVLISMASGIDRAQGGAASTALQGVGGEFLRWLQACAAGTDDMTRGFAGAILGHDSVQALTYL